MNSAATILITGGTGTIGSALSHLLLEKGYNVIVVSRESKEAQAAPGNAAGRRSEASRSSAQGSSYSVAHWDTSRQFIDPAAIASADYIVHLAGAGVADRRWSAKRRKEIVESRTLSSALIVKALKEIPNKVQAVVSASAIGWYGADPSIPNPRPFVETDPADMDFLGETCRLWESSISTVAAAGRRLVIIRTGIVLNKGKGALNEFSKPVNAGVAAILGNGKQVVSWIHIDDLCRLYLNAIENKNWQGVYNGVAPAPVDNRTLTLGLARLMKGRSFIKARVPSFILKLILGEMSVEVLKSTTVSAAKTSGAGFQFLYPSIDSALKELTS